jgi:hypothetical protein
MVNFLDISADIVEPLICKLVLGPDHTYVSERNIHAAAKIAAVCTSFHDVIAKIPRLVEIFSKKHVKRLPAYFSNERNKNSGTNKILIELKSGDSACPCLCVKVINDVLLFAPGVNRLHLHGLELSFNLISDLSKGLKNFPFLHVLCISKW